MIFPVYAYGSSVLRKVAKNIEKDYAGLAEFIKNMFETMNSSDGVGLAAPQIGKSIRLFVVDASPLAEDEPELEGFKKVFINAHIVEQRGEEWEFNEGCLSIPGIREDIKRKPEITIQYYDENFNYKEEFFDGIKARIIQHEYDHLDGILFTDKVTPIKKRLLKNKLAAISKGKVDVKYKMIFPKK
ncbi:MAG: peptide deformylase [Chlorobi bacterium]|nr:peptide deformylase [Chlorobiota bacterium]